MSKIVNCEYSKTIMEEPTCNAFDVNRYGEIICSEENCIILKLKEQLQAKEQECEKYKKGFEEDFAFNNELINDKLQIGLERNRYKQALDEIEEFCIVYSSNHDAYETVYKHIQDIIHKAKDGEQ